MIRSRRLWCAASVAICVTAAQGQSRVPALTVTDALNLYERGRYPEFFEALNRDGAVDRTLFKTFEADANRWVSASGATRERRTIVAASVALEIAHVLRDQPADRAGRYLVWASQLMHKNPPATPPPVERLWYLASIAGMEELDEPWALTAGVGSGSSVLDQLCRALGRGGQLEIAARRFPNEPRFKLARVQLAEDQLLSWLTELGPSFIGFLVQINRATPETSRPSSDPWETLMRDQSAALMRRYAEVPSLLRDYAELSKHESLRAEVELHAGHLEYLAMHWSAALAHLHRVAELSGETYLRYLSLYLIGRTFHYTGDISSSVAAFERAVETVPNGRAAATSLAAELILSDRGADRDRAYPLLQAAHADIVPDDPWRLFRHGDAWLWASYMSQLRAELR